jgi:hypothetical protein
MTEGRDENVIPDRGDWMPPPSQEWQETHGWKVGKAPPSAKMCEAGSEQEKAACTSGHPGTDSKGETPELGKTFYDPWTDPPPPRWPSGVLSRETEETLAAISLRDGVDFPVQAMAHIAAASGAAPKDARFAPFCKRRLEPAAYSLGSGAR